MWPEVYPADAHDAPLLPRQMRAVTGAVGFCNIGPCGRKDDQLMLMLLPSCLIKCAITGAVGFAAEHTACIVVVTCAERGRRVLPRWPFWAKCGGLPAFLPGVAHRWGGGAWT